MPKNDPRRNQPNYKVGGSEINEYEFDQNKGQVTEEEHRMPGHANHESAGAMDEKHGSSGRGGGPSSNLNS
jgi:hypothetical protein